ncbi:MAG: hypothetical protein GY720_16100 [bacterium]|nr:hypothetical protein [bacterium]
MSGTRWRGVFLGLVAGAMLAASFPAVADVGDAVLQGRNNRADRRTTLKSAADATTLRLINSSGSGPALSLVVAPGVAPLKVSSSRRVEDLNADLLDGKSSNYFAPKQARPGQTLVGAFGAAGDGTFLVHAATFATPLTKGVPQSRVHYVLPAAGPTSDCPGVFEAAAGHLCIYATWERNATFSGIGRIDGENLNSGASRYGFTILWTGTSSSANVRGNWAFTVPAASDIFDPAEATTPGVRTDAGLDVSLTP